MQAGARGIVHQHPVGFAKNLQASENGVRAFRAAINDGDLGVVRQRQLAEANVARADGNHHPLYKGVCQQRGDRVFENRFVTD